MTFSFNCPSCKSLIEADSDLCGEQLPCPHCQRPIDVPVHFIHPGKVIGGFKVTKTLGTGAMGEVYLAKQQETDRMVALKTLRAAVTHDPDIIKRFMQEIQILSKLHHPNIVNLVAGGEQDGIHYLAMEYIDGESMDIRMRRDVTLPEKECLKVMFKVAGALADAWNEYRILHRDIKPANIMIDSYGEPKLTDLGIAKSLLSTSLTMTGSVFGTPHFMSPEQAKGDPDIDCRADIYSMGVTLFNLLTGQTPFVGKPMDVLHMVITEEPPKPRSVNPAISEHCEALILSMMAKEPDDRPENWESLRQAVKRVHDGKPGMVTSEEVPDQSGGVVGFMRKLFGGASSNER